MSSLYNSQKNTTPYNLSGLSQVENGTNGTNGLQGATGPQGIQGIQGIQGATGPQGIQGPQGATSGIVGPTGATGPQGATSGIIGPTGVQGAQGIQGVTGPQGLPGSKGDKGDRGTDGAIVVVPLPFGIGPPGGPGPIGPPGQQGIQGEPGVVNNITNSNYSALLDSYNATLVQATGTLTIRQPNQNVDSTASPTFNTLNSTTANSTYVNTTNINIGTGIIQHTLSYDGTDFIHSYLPITDPNEDVNQYLSTDFVAGNPLNSNFRRWKWKTLPTSVQTVSNSLWDAVNYGYQSNIVNSTLFVRSPDQNLDTDGTPHWISTRVGDTLHGTYTLMSDNPTITNLIGYLPNTDPLQNDNMFLSTDYAGGNFRRWKWKTLSTDLVPEGTTNLYFTPQRARAVLTMNNVGVYTSTFDNLTGKISVTSPNQSVDINGTPSFSSMNLAPGGTYKINNVSITTDNIPEGTNKYFTTSNVYNSLSVNTPSTYYPLNYSSSTGTFTLTSPNQSVNIGASPSFSALTLTNGTITAPASTDVTLNTLTVTNNINLNIGSFNIAKITNSGLSLINLISPTSTDLTVNTTTGTNNINLNIGSSNIAKINSSGLTITSTKAITTTAGTLNLKPANFTTRFNNDGTHGFVEIECVGTTTTGQVMFYLPNGTLQALMRADSSYFYFFNLNAMAGCVYYTKGGVVFYCSYGQATGTGEIVFKDNNVEVFTANAVNGLTMKNSNPITSASGTPLNFNSATGQPINFKVGGTTKFYVASFGIYAISLPSATQSYILGYDTATGKISYQSPPTVPLSLTANSITAQTGVVMNLNADAGINFNIAGATIGSISSTGLLINNVNSIGGQDLVLSAITGNIRSDSSFTMYGGNLNLLDYSTGLIQSQLFTDTTGLIISTPSAKDIRLKIGSSVISTINSSGMTINNITSQTTTDLSLNTTTATNKINFNIASTNIGYVNSSGMTINNISSNNNNNNNTGANLNFNVAASRSIVFNVNNNNAFTFNSNLFGPSISSFSGITLNANTNSAITLNCGTDTFSISDTTGALVNSTLEIQGLLTQLFPVNIWYKSYRSTYSSPVMMKATSSTNFNNVGSAVNVNTTSFFNYDLCNVTAQNWTPYWGTTSSTYGFLYFPYTGVYSIQWSFSVNTNIQCVATINKNWSLSNWSSAIPSDDITALSCLDTSPNTVYNSTISATVRIDTAGSSGDYVCFCLYNFSANTTVSGNNFRSPLVINKIG